MKTFRFGDICWYLGECWQYIGMDEDGVIHLCRPIKEHPFDIIEFEQVYIGEESEETDSWYKENGETFNENCKRKGIDVPSSSKYYYDKMNTKYLESEGMKEYVGSEYIIQVDEKGLTVKRNDIETDGELFKWEELKTMLQFDEDIAKIINDNWFDYI